MYKWLILGLFVFVTIYRAFLYMMDYKSRNNKIPTNVLDIYNEEEYRKWREYTAKETSVSFIFLLLENTALGILLFSGILSNLSNSISDNVYAKSFLTLGIVLGVSFVFDFISSYISTMIIETKYGLNTQKFGGFLKDQIKSLIILSIIISGLMALYILVYQSLGDYILIIFGGILFILCLCIAFLFPVLSKVFNKFKPLEDGTLKEKLITMLEGHGYKVKEIKVMLASEKTTKVNAYFAGFGKMKTIVLYDTLLDLLTEEEIIAVFAHEMGHGLHKDTLKGQIQTTMMLICITFLLWGTTKISGIWLDFGYKSIDYGFLVILFMNVILAAFMPIFGIISSYFSRRHEYLADKEAVKNGYGEALITSLKKLCKKNMANLSPMKITILLEYSHPTVSNRIDAIEKALKE